MDLFIELKTLITTLNHRRIPYALCGGLAMAFHAFPRATMDIDLLIEPKNLQRVKDLALTLGFTLETVPMSFKKNTIQIHRLIKPLQPESDVLPLDLLLVTPRLAGVWTTRKTMKTEFGKICVVSRNGLVRLKQIRSSGQDKDDMMKLKRQK